MQRTKVSYSLTRRPSQAKVASIYQDIIRERCEMIGNSDEADVIIIHHPPWHYTTSYAIHPLLKEKYVIACCVSHADDIPATWKRGLNLVQEVWTCSQYCFDIFSRYHSNVIKLPYVVDRDLAASADARECAERLIGYEPGLVYFFTIAQVAEPRKNIEALVRSFVKVSKNLPNARLVIKASSDDRALWDSHPQVTLLPMTLPHEYINALYQLTDVYVSAHHSESWGTTISDAMLFDKPVIATGYSGNMEYMNAANSFLLPFREDTVPANARGVAIEPGMKWVTPDPASLEESFIRLYNTNKSPETLEKVARACHDVGSFDRCRAARIIHERINLGATWSHDPEPLVETISLNSEPSGGQPCVAGKRI
jgi:glycosyltransferase involved in cell wall biosynthesis